MGVLSPLDGVKCRTRTLSSSANTLMCLTPYFMTSWANTAVKRVRVRAIVASVFIWRLPSRLSYVNSAVVSHKEARTKIGRLIRPQGLHDVNARSACGWERRSDDRGGQ